MHASEPVRLQTLLGDYPNTRALKRNALRSSLVAFDFADVKLAHTAFKRVVRDLEFDVAELAIVTFLHVSEGIAGHHPPTVWAYFAEAILGMGAMVGGMAASFRV